jgi:hypothetical protein
MNSVSTDKHIGRDALTIVKLGFHAGAAIGECDEAMPDMQSLGRQRTHEHRQHVGPMRLIMRIPEYRNDRVAKRRLQQSAAVVPAPLVRC